jgi:hypothetical protein
MPRFSAPDKMRLAYVTKWLLGMSVVLCGSVGRVAAADSEIRDFAILVDGKKAGTYQMSLNFQDSGVAVMSGKAQVRISYLVRAYVYTYEGTEVWKSGKLSGFRSNSNDNGKRFQVTAQAEKDSLRVTSNGRERLTRADMWLTSYWRLPAARYRNQAVPVLDADTGKDFNGYLKFLGTEQLMVAGQRQTCVHYRVTGGPSSVDLWFDGKERLVRQEYVEDGHQTVLYLAGIRR